MALKEEDFKELFALYEEQQGERAMHKPVWDSIVKYMGLTYGKWYDQRLSSKDLFDITAVKDADTFADGVASLAFGKGTDWLGLEVKSVKEGNSKEQATKLCQSVLPGIYTFLDEGHFYDAARLFVKNAATLGTSCMLFEYDKSENRACFKTLAQMTYFPVVNKWNEVSALFRTVKMTKKEAIKAFGEEKLPDEIRRSRLPRNKWTFINYMGPATDWDFDVPGEGDYISIWWRDGERKKTLKEERLQEKPFACWRWDLPLEEGAWGVNSPGQMSLPVMKRLNRLQESYDVLVEQIAKGHWKKTKGLQVNFKAGGVTELDEDQDFTHLAYQGDLSWTDNRISQLVQVLDTLWKISMFQVLTASVDKTKSATEAAGLLQEQQSQAQNFPSRLEAEFLEPLISWCFKYVLIYKDLPPDVTSEQIDSINGMDMEIRFISPMYKNQQRLAQLTPTLQWIQDVMQLAQANTNVLDRIDFDTLVEKDHSIRNALPDILIDLDKATKAREVRAQAQAQAQQRQNNLEALDAAANAYSKMSKAAEEGSGIEALAGGSSNG